MPCTCKNGSALADTLLIRWRMLCAGLVFGRFAVVSGVQGLLELLVKPRALHPRVEQATSD